MLGDHDVLAAIAVKTLAAARKFYEGKLNFKVVHTESDQAVTYQSGKSQLLVYQSRFAGTNKATAAAWMVKDVEGLAKDLKAKGVSLPLRLGHRQAADQAFRVVREADSVDTIRRLQLSRANDV
jgi:catechol 2,3-dioxygenase-like lactoylglutathione lyase family enzyme